MYDRDTNSVRLVGSLLVVLGSLLLVLTFLGALFALFAGASPNPGNVGQGLLATGLGLVISMTLISCGTQFQKLHFRWRSDMENLRLVWTALVLVMTLSTIAAGFILPPLAVVSIFVLLASWSIRGAVIRLTH